MLRIRWRAMVDVCQPKLLAGSRGGMGVGAVEVARALRLLSGGRSGQAQRDGAEETCGQDGQCQGLGPNLVMFVNPFVSVAISVLLGGLFDH